MDEEEDYDVACGFSHVSWTGNSVDLWVSCCTMEEEDTAFSN